MRVSILVNSVDPTSCHDYAMLWLDPARQAWTQQTCVGIALPPEGLIVERHGETLLTAADAESTALLTLGNFRLDARERLTSIRGTARWFSLTRQASVEGLWNLRAIERSTDRPQRRRAGSGLVSRPTVRDDGGPESRACR